MIPLTIYHLKRKYFYKIEAELKEAWAPGDLGYGTRVPADMLIYNRALLLCDCSYNNSFRGDIFCLGMHDSFFGIR